MGGRTNRERATRHSSSPAMCRKSNKGKKSNKISACNLTARQVEVSVRAARSRGGLRSSRMTKPNENQTTGLRQNNKLVGR